MRVDRGGERGPRVGLVLGAGGIVGSSFLEGALAGLAEATGWDARTAHLVVGTSAGAGLGATLRAGVRERESYARTVGDPVDPGVAARIAGLPPVDLPDPGVIELPRGRPHAALLPRAFHRRPWRLGLVWSGIRRRGVVSTRPIGDRIRALFDAPWPDDALWIPALRADDGRRVVFGRDRIDPEPDVGTAVEASSAVPGFFEPVRIAERDHVDGAGHSPTNLDLCAGLGLDLVVVVSPMSASADALRWSVSSAARVYHSRMLDRERTLVEATATPVVVLEPGEEDLAAMGPSSMAVARRIQVARQAFRSAVRTTRRPEVAERLRALTA